MRLSSALRLNLGIIREHAFPQPLMEFGGLPFYFLDFCGSYTRIMYGADLQNRFGEFSLDLDAHTGLWEALTHGILSDTRRGRLVIGDTRDFGDFTGIIRILAPVPVIRRKRPGFDFRIRGASPYAV